jgi:tetratricopeptide (TPR) repeat protein
MLELVDVHIDQEDFISALGVLDSLLREELTAEQKTDLAILQADIHRSIGLLDRARSVLKLARSQTNQNPTRQARLNAALARCHIDAGDFDQARTLLMGVLPMVTDGPVRGEISVLLGQVCLKTKKYDQAETIAKPVIEMDCPRATRLEAQRILGEVYLARKEYEKAAVMFSGMGQAPASQPAADTQAGQEEAS